MASRGIRHQVLPVAVGAVVPLAISAAWIPIRTQVPNVDLALIVVVAVAAIGALGRHSAVIVAAISASLWFEFFDTAPFERLGIARSPDVETTIVLAVVALVIGELAIALRRHQMFAREGSENLSTVRGATELVASGEELVRVIEAVVVDLTRVLGLTSCRYEAGEPDLHRAQVDRAGGLVPAARGRAIALGLDTSTRTELELPVIVEGAAIGRFVLGLPPGRQPARESLLAAVTLADTVATAFLAQAPPPPPPGRGLSVPLRVLRSAAAVPSGEGKARGGGQPTSGLSCALGTSRS